MSGYRAKKFTAKTPIPTILAEVTLYEDVWEDHVLCGHPELEGREDDVEQTVERPTAIFESSTTQGNYVFVNESITDEMGKSLRVAAKPHGPTGGEVRSAYFSSNTTNVGEKIWSQSTNPAGKSDK